MAYEINTDKYSFAAAPDKKVDDYTLHVARKLVSSEAELRKNSYRELSLRIDSNDGSIEALNSFRTDTEAELKKRELLSNKVEAISKNPSHHKYPSEQAVAEYVAGLGEENGGHVHVNKKVLDSLEAEDIQRWNTAAENVGDVVLMPLIESVNTLIDRADEAQEDIDALESEVERLNGFAGKETVFNADGSITETSNGNTKTTVFNSDGSITEADNKGNTKTTVFNPDGSITEVIS